MDSAPRQAAEDWVSRDCYERERLARKKAETLLEASSRALFEANAVLMAQAKVLEQAVQERTGELERARSAAESASAAKSGFLAMISHEIRTPLNGVLGMATALVESDLPPEQREMAEIIESCGLSLLELLNDVLDLSKIEADKMELEERDFDLDAFCREVVKIHAPLAESKELRLMLRQAEGARGWLHSDPTRLRQVVTNLVSNAIKFTARGFVEIDLSREGNLLWIRVRDTGPGVPRDRRDRLFEAFSQADVSIARKFGGTGLGLAISRRICRLMGGDLTYAPAPGGGACFEASLRVADAAPGTDVPRSRPDGAEVALRDRRWRILVAEDSDTNQQVLRLLLRDYDLNLDMVRNGAAAVEAHVATSHDLILMDVNMPVMNGLDAARMIREIEGARGVRRVPIVALTANAMTHQVSSYLRQGIDAHVAKPVRRPDLVATMGRLLSETLQSEKAAMVGAGKAPTTEADPPSATQAEWAPSASPATKDST